VIGDDEWGRKILAGFVSEHVNTTGLIVEHDRTSPLSCILVEQKTGKRTIIHHRGSVDPLSEDDIASDLIASADLLLIDSLHPEAALAAARMARAAGIRVVLDTGACKPGAVDLVRQSDVIIAPEYFAPKFTPGKTLAEMARHLFHHGAEIVVVTRGERGGVCFTEQEEFAFPAFQVDVVDTTGAGDVFHGAFAYGLVREWDLRRAATFASAVAALKCARLGGRRGIPTFKEALDFLRQRAVEPELFSTAQ
jgi:ribokinase